MQTNEQQIMQKAITKAMHGGLELFPNELLLEPDIARMCSVMTLYEARYVIFSHRFAKAFWGSNKVDDFGYDVVRLNSPIEPDGSPTFLTPRTHKADNTIYTEDQVQGMPEAWFYHLQQLAITPEDERLKYIERFL